AGGHVRQEPDRLAPAGPRGDRVRGADAARRGTAHARRVARRPQDGGRSAAGRSRRRVRGVDSSDFTEDGYRCAGAVAKRSYSFDPFGTKLEDPHVLWRHDVDASVHRAARLARIEAEEGVRATYFLSFHSAFYNLLERPVFDAARAVLGAGHWLGLHF